MTINQLRKAVRGESFRAFTVCLADGRQLRVTHPECIAIPPEAARTFVVAERDEDYRIIDLLMVTSIDFVGSASSRKRRVGNGR